LTVLGAAGTVEGFDTLWQAAADSTPGLAPPHAYVHHRFADMEALQRSVTGCGWAISEVRPITSVRHCTEEELWRWLWGSLPLRTIDGSFLSPDEKHVIEDAVRHEFFAQAQRFRFADRYEVRSLAHMVIAMALALPSPTQETEARD
jgi:hypothetical protein